MPITSVLIHVGGAEMKRLALYLTLCIQTLGAVTMVPVSVWAASPRVSTVYYGDTRGFNNLTVYVSSNRMPLGLSIWGMTDLMAAQNVPDERWNLVRSFSEFRLSWSRNNRLLGLQGLALQAEYNDFMPGGDPLTRLGLAYRHGMPGLSGSTSRSGWLLWRVFPYETDGNGGQISLIYMLPLPGPLNIQGFADWNHNPDGPDRWVFEPQLNIELHERIWLALEYRYNGYEEANAGLEGEGLGLGLRLDY